MPFNIFFISLQLAGAAFIAIGFWAWSEKVQLRKFDVFFVKFLNI